MVSEASHSIRVATSEIEKPSQLQCCPSYAAGQLPRYPEPPLGREQAGAIYIHLVPRPCLLYSCLPCSPAAFGLAQLVVHSSPENISVLLCLSLPCLGQGHIIPCGNFEGRTGETNDPRTKRMALHLFCEAETQSQVTPSTEDRLWFCMFSFQLLLK